MTAWTRMLGGRVEYIDGEKFRTRCLHTGGGSKPPLILLHGIGGHAETYLKNMKPLADALAERDIYAIDFIGHGYSSKPEDSDYTIPELAEHVEDVITAVGHDRAHIHGESLGGWVAGWIGINRPEIAASIGLNTTAGVNELENVSEEAKEKETKEIQDLYDRTMQMLENGCPRDAVRHRLDWLFVEDLAPEDELIDIRHRIYQREDVQDEMKTIYDSVIKSQMITKEGESWMFSPSELESIETPTLIIHSEQNPGTSVETIEKVDDLIPNSQYTLYESSAHWPQWEEPDRYNSDTIEFITDIE